MKFYKKSNELDFFKMFKKIRKKELEEFKEKNKDKGLKPNELESLALFSIFVEYLATKYENDLEFQERCQKKAVIRYAEASDEEREFENEKKKIKIEFLKDHFSIEEIAKRHHIPVLLVKDILNDSFTVGMRALEPENGRPVTDVIVDGNAGFLQTAVVEESLMDIMLEYEELIRKEEGESK